MVVTAVAMVHSHQAFDPFVWSLPFREFLMALATGEVSYLGRFYHFRARGPKCGRGVARLGRLPLTVHGLELGVGPPTS